MQPVLSVVAHVPPVHVEHEVWPAEDVYVEPVQGMHWSETGELLMVPGGQSTQLLLKPSLKVAFCPAEHSTQLEGSSQSLKPTEPEGQGSHVLRGWTEVLVSDGV